MILQLSLELILKLAIKFEKIYKLLQMLFIQKNSLLNWLGPKVDTGIGPLDTVICSFMVYLNLQFGFKIDFASGICPQSDPEIRSKMNLHFAL